MRVRMLFRFCVYVGFVAVAIASVLFAARPVFATGEFQADYDVQYAVATSGKTIVTQHVTLTNKLSNYYPRQYSLLLDSDKISQVIAFDDGGLITPTISVKDGKTEITLAFNTKIVGLGKTTAFSLRYEHSGITSQNGSIWEIYVPGITNDPDLGAYNVTLAVPPTFGPAAYLSPPPANGNTWTKDQMIRGGISGAYGAAQNFSVKLHYTISNPDLVPRYENIALPPDTSFQKVVINSLDPKPTTVSRDGDGNWLARYDLLPTQTKSVTGVFTVTTYIKALDTYHDPNADMSQYLKPQKYWEVTDPKIQSLAKTYTTAQQIYSYVADTLKYNYSKVNTGTTRLGALGALDSPDQAVCTEFTDLFIAIARAAGIPARRNVGYAYTNNPKLRPLSLVTDVLHAWPEYFDSKQNIWIPVDPTWANTTGGSDYFTKLDFNHIVFAKNGLDSTYPYPAGFYHAVDSPSHDVDVSFAQTSVKQTAPDITSSIDFPPQVAAGTKQQGYIVVSNAGSDTAYTIPVSVHSTVGTMNLTEVIPELLPYGVIRIPVSVTLPQTLTTLNGTIQATVGEETKAQQFTVQPLATLIVIVAVIVVTSIIIASKLIQMLVWKLSKTH